MSAPAGWFADPAGHADTFRWWDGQGWTRWLTGDPSSSPPPSPPAEESEPASTPEPLPSGRSGPRDGPALRIPVAVALVTGALVVALVAVGLTVVLTEDRIRSGPAVAPPTTTQDAGLVLDSATRTLRIENVRLVLPGPPYACAERPGALTPALSSALTCAALIHTDYAGTDDWYATTGLGLISDSLVARGDPAETGRNVFAALRSRSFSGRRTMLREFEQLQSPVGGQQGVFFAGEVHYAIKGLPSRYDRMVVGVIGLPSGRQVTFFSVRPDDTPAPTLAALNRSIETLSAR